MYRWLKEGYGFALTQRLLCARDVLLSQSPSRLVLVSDLDAYCSEQQFAPFHASRAELRNRLNLVIDHRVLKEVLAAPHSCLKDADVIGLKLSFRTEKERALRIVREVIEHKGQAKLVYFDGDDDSTIQWPELLPLVDLYVKKHVFSDPRDYEKRFVGRNNLTDYVARHYGHDFSDDPIPASVPVDRRYLDRLHLGYNIALDRKIVELYARTKGAWSNQNRPNDIVCRASLDGWLARLRDGVAPALRELGDAYRLVLPTDKVDQRTYDREMSESKICVCPLGYGEICWRDFEAVLWGCLMIKPNMDAIRTRPNIYVPYETYIPVAWDLSDLAATCRYYLEHPELRKRIARNAYVALSAFYEREAFFDEVAQILERVQTKAPTLEVVLAASPLLAPIEFVGRESEELI